MVLSARLKFSVVIPYEHEHYGKLARYSIGHPRKTDEGLCEWSFNLGNFGEVVALLGQPISFERRDVEFVLNKLHLDLIAIEMEPFKGYSGFDVFPEPNGFTVREYRKEEDKMTGAIAVKEHNNHIPMESVIALWGVMKKYKVGIETKSKTVAEYFCEAVGIDEYFKRESGSFDYAKFFGKRSKGYMRMYYPIKILEHYGCVKHHKYGTLERLKEEFDIQNTLINGVKE